VGPELFALPAAGIGAIGAAFPDPHPERATARICQAPGCGNPLPSQRRRFCSDDCRRRGHRHERYHETGEYAQMTVRIVRSLARRIGGGDAAEFAALWELVTEAETAAALAIDELRAKGYSWADLAGEVGMAKQSLHQWRQRRPGWVPDAELANASDHNTEEE
jgi:hypothetical protein